MPSRACWLVRKCEAEFATRAPPDPAVLAVGDWAFLVLVFAYALAEIFQSCIVWIDRPICSYSGDWRGRRNSACAQHPGVT